MPTTRPTITDGEVLYDSATVSAQTTGEEEGDIDILFPAANVQYELLGFPRQILNRIGWRVFSGSHRVKIYDENRWKISVCNYQVFIANSRWKTIQDMRGAFDRDTICYTPLTGTSGDAVGGDYRTRLLTANQLNLIELALPSRGKLTPGNSYHMLVYKLGIPVRKGFTTFTIANAKISIIRPSGQIHPLGSRTVEWEDKYHEQEALRYKFYFRTVNGSSRGAWQFIQNYDIARGTTATRFTFTWTKDLALNQNYEMYCAAVRKEEPAL